MTGPFEGLGPIPMSQALAGTLALAAKYAQSQQHVEVSLEHLLLALIEDEDARIVMTSAGVDVERLKFDVTEHVGGIETRLPTDHPGTAAISEDLRRILNAAAAAASGRRNDINGGIVLAAIIGDAHSRAAAMLQAHGLTFGAAIEVVKQRFGPEADAARQQPQQRPAPRPMAPSRDFDVPPQQDADSVLADARARLESRRAPVGPPPSQPTSPQPGAPAGFQPGPQSEPYHSVAPPAPAREATPQPGPAAAPAPPTPPPAALHEREPSLEPANPAPPQGKPMPAPSPAREPREQHPPQQQRPSAPAQPPANQTWTPPPSNAPPAPQPPPFRAPPPLNPNIGMRPPPPTGPFRQEHPTGAESGDATPRPAPAGAAGSGPSGPGRPRAPIGQPAPGAPGAQASSPARPRAPLPPVDDVFGAPGPSLDAATIAPPRPAGAAAQAPSPAAAQARGPAAQARAKRDAAGAGAKKKRRGRTELQTGQLIENIPRVMRVALPSLVEARIAKSEVKNLADGIAGEGAAFRHDVLITRAMSVRLRAPDGGFFIETSSPETQWIENALGLMADEYASWRWTVTPKSRGRRRLQLIISARTVGADGLAAETALPDQVVEIRVRTNYTRTLLALAAWVGAAIAGGLLARFGSDIWTALGAFFSAPV